MINASFLVKLKESSRGKRMLDAAALTEARKVRKAVSRRATLLPSLEMPEFSVARILLRLPIQATARVA